MISRSSGSYCCSQLPPNPNSSEASGESVNTAWADETTSCVGTSIESAAQGITKNTLFIPYLTDLKLHAGNFNHPPANFSQLARV